MGVDLPLPLLYSTSRAVAPDGGGAGGERTLGVMLHKSASRFGL